MMGFVRRYQLALMAVAAASIAVLLYWPSLTLPVIYDDLLHIRISKGLNLVSVWLPTDQFGFYRPLTFLPFILIKLLFGYYPNWLLHGLNVAQHSLNVLLLITLSWRLWRDQVRAVVAGLLFAFFPFSYQAIAVYGHNVHPTTAGLILIGCHMYLSALRSNDNRDRSRDRRQRRWWWATGFIFLLALLSHESAVLFGAFAALIHWNCKGKIPRLRFPRAGLNLRHVPPWFILLLLGALYALLYQFLPISRGPQAAAEEDAGLWLRVLYVLQAAAFPLAWFAHMLPGLGASWLILGSFAFPLGLTAWASKQPGHRLPLLLGWGWWAVATLLIAIPLPTDYLLHGPRLLYLSAVGLAFLWSLLLTGQKPGVLQKGFLLITVIFILVTNWGFVRGRLVDYDRLSNPVRVMARVMAEQPAAEGILVVNLPQWLAPRRNTYAVGAELVAMLGNYLFVDELILENISGGHKVITVVIPDLLRNPAYPYGIHDETAFRGDAATGFPIPSDWAPAGSQIFIVRYTDAGPETTRAGALHPAGHGRSPLAHFGPYELLEASGSFCDGVVEASLVWSLADASLVDSSISIFVQLLAEDGRLIAQADGPLLGMRPDLLRLLPGWEARDLRQLRPDGPELPSRLLVGVYDFTTGDRFQAYSGQQTPLPDNALRLPVAPCP
jgi:hypothetical protein